MRKRSCEKEKLVISWIIGSVTFVTKLSKRIHAKQGRLLFLSYILLFGYLVTWLFVNKQVDINSYTRLKIAMSLIAGKA
jgi:hypothetical protein